MKVNLLISFCDLCILTSPALKGEALRLLCT